MDFMLMACRRRQEEEGQSHLDACGQGEVSKTRFSCGHHMDDPFTVKVLCCKPVIFLC